MSGREIAWICLSGGLDSTSLMLRLLGLGFEVHGVSFDYGQKHSVELERLKFNLEYLRSREWVVEWSRIDLSGIRAHLHSALTTPGWSVPEGHYRQANMVETVVPNRNAIFTSIAFAMALSTAKRCGRSVRLSLGVHAGDHEIYPDCRPEFYEALFAAFRAGNWESESVEPYLPYLSFDKAQILDDARKSCFDLDLDFETVFRNTCTSYSPDANGKSAGLSGSDVERILAFHSLGLKDPLEYHRPWPQVVEQALAYRERMT